MPSKRVIRVSAVLKEEISTLIARCKDLEGYIVTVAEVEMTPDLRKAFIYISLIEPDKDTVDEVVRILNGQRKEWQAVLNKRLKLKFTPHLQFGYSDFLQRGDRVMEILQEIKDEYAEDADEPEDPPEDKR